MPQASLRFSFLKLNQPSKITHCSVTTFNIWAPILNYERENFVRSLTASLPTPLVRENPGKALILLSFHLHLKKKATHQSDNHKQEAPQQEPQPERQVQHYTQSQQPAAMDEQPPEKLQSLKNLNALLLKETSERRQQIDSLLETKEALESALNRSDMGSKALKDQLSKAIGNSVGLELEKSVLFVFMATQIREMGFLFDRLEGEKNDIDVVKSEREAEIAILKGEVNKLTASLENERHEMTRLSRERDEIKNDFDDVVAEANRLREKLFGMDIREEKLREAVEKLRTEGEELMEEKNQKERTIEELTAERDLAQSNSAESATAIDKLKGEIDGVLREKNETQKQKDAQERKIIELMSDLKQLDENVKHLRQEEGLMRSRIVDLDTTLDQATQKEKELSMEIGTLLKEKKEKEQNIEMLTEKNDNIERVLEMVQKDLEDKQRMIDETVRDKNEIEQVKVSQASEIFELQKEVDELKVIMQNFLESCRDLEEKNKQFASEVNHYRNVVAEMTVERDDLKMGFDEEKSKVKNLMVQVAEMEDKIEQTAAVLSQVESEREKLMEGKKLMESRVDILMKEKDEVHKSLLEAQRVSDDLRAKIEFSSSNLRQALAMLKSTVSIVCHSKTVEDNGGKLEVEIQPYAEELDAIKNAFKNKNKAVEDMKQQLASLENSVAEAHKRKNMWTVISSATTIFATVLAAFVARGR